MLETLYNVISIMETVMSIIHLLISLCEVFSESSCPRVDKLYITPTPMHRAYYL